MNYVINYLLKSIASSSQSLKKKNVLVDKPWALIDDSGEIQKLIFKKNNELVLSKNGKVLEGSWEYFPEAHALLINRSYDKLLLTEQYIDENVLIFKRDGSANEYFAFSNENTIPDYDIAKYLNEVKCIQLGIIEKRLNIGHTLQIIKSATYGIINGSHCELRDTNYNTVDFSDGEFFTDDFQNKYIIQNKRIIKIIDNSVRKLEDGRSCNRKITMYNFR